MSDEKEIFVVQFNNSKEIITVTTDYDKALEALNTHINHKEIRTLSVYLNGKLLNKNLITTGLIY